MKLGTSKRVSKKKYKGVSMFCERQNSDESNILSFNQRGDKFIFSIDKMDKTIRVTVDGGFYFELIGEFKLDCVFRATEKEFKKFDFQNEDIWFFFKVDDKYIFGLKGLCNGKN
jgi:hypothetical protein